MLWECNRPTQETVQCFVAMLRMGAEERNSPAAAQLERHVNQYLKARPTPSSLADSVAVYRPRPTCTVRMVGRCSCRALQCHRCLLRQVQRYCGLVSAAVHCDPQSRVGEW